VASESCTTLGTGPAGELQGELLSAKETWGEPNGPNTLDTCFDGNGGAYKQAESVEAITVEAVGGGVLKAGGKAKVIAKVYTYGNGQNRVDFYYSSTPGPNPKWKPIVTDVGVKGGLINVVSEKYILPAAELQAVRVSIRWIGENPTSSPCPTLTGKGVYSDVDDLSFVVDTTSSGGMLAFALPQPGSVEMPQPSEEPQIDCSEVVESDRCAAAIDCEWRSVSILGSFMSLGRSSCHPAQ